MEPLLVYLSPGAWTHGSAENDKANDAWAAIVAVWKATAAELEGGYSFGVRTDAPDDAPDTEKWRGLTWEEMLRHPWVRESYVRGVRRFGVFQKGKWRVPSMTLANAKATM